MIPIWRGSRQEIEANAFAMELLMPAAWIRADVPAPLDPYLQEDRICALAARYDVSEIHMVMRLVALKLIRQ